MYHLDRRKPVRGQAVVSLLTVLSLTAVGGGVGFWLGRQADFTLLKAELDRGLATASSHPRTTPTPLTDALDTDMPRVEAITASLGGVQAELTRLDALGERLVEMSGLDAQEFDFRNPPPAGGPEEAAAARDYTIKVLAGELGSVVSLLKDRKRKLEILEEAINGRGLTVKSVPTGWPVQAGYITSNYGFRIHPTKHRRLFHQGVDFAAPYGSPVVAVADGLVTFSGRRSGYGNLVEIRHSNGYTTRYGHNQSNLVQEGQQVHQGQRIGAVGATGTATGPHVHFEVLKDGEHLDPMPFASRQTVNTLMTYNPG